jgi:membrane-bound ClpP family serine protease
MAWVILGSLLSIGLILVLLEIIFVPGTTLVGILGVLFTGIGIFYSFITLDSQTAWLVLAVTLCINLLALIYGFKSGLWKKFALKEVISSRSFDERLYGLIEGQTGKAISDLKPYGKAEFGDKIYEVKSESGFISVGAELIIVKLEENRIIVKG